MMESGNSLKLAFNPAPSRILHIDLNSCFATIEQQANPLLRGKPIVVAAYTTPSGCVLAPSVEAKRFGIKTGMRVKDARRLCPNVVVLPSDPWKYRNVHLGLRKIMASFTDDFYPKSIDEFVLNLSDYIVVHERDICDIGMEIKQRIKKEVGDWLTVSIGIAPNRYLAKIGASLHKPDGLDEINQSNHTDIYSKLKLTDLTGIKDANAFRLERMGIVSVHDFYNASVQTLKAAFNSITGYYWYLRLRGWEIDNVEFSRRSYGNSYSLPKPLVSPQELSPILCKLCEKMGARLRRAGFKASGIHLAVWYRDGSFWHKGKTTKVIFDSRDFFKEAFRILTISPSRKPVRNLAVSCFNLVKQNFCQLDLFDKTDMRRRAVESVDKINRRWGEFVVTSARMVDTGRFVPDRIEFGNVKEIEEFTLSP